MKETEPAPATFLTEKNKEAFYGSITPQFPANIDNLNKIYKNPKRKEIDLLGEAVKLIEGYLGEGVDFKTTDGYEWAKAYEFKRGEATVLVAFPKLDDNRSIALYVTGEAGEWTAHRLVAFISGALGNLQRMQP
ncbi:hypothetical protein HY502_00800 [Candidatus Woesebacteria bacterium]|nr:hypothetical protein [Candidatus Woesebacteria bacterium]